MSILADTIIAFTFVVTTICVAVLCYVYRELSKFI